MLKIRTLTLALGAIALLTTGITATAGSWPDLPSRKIAQATAVAPAPALIANQAPAAGREMLSAGDFEYVGGDADWQLRQHKFTLRGGNFAHASDCTLMAAASSTASGPSSRGSGPTIDRSPGA